MVPGSAIAPALALEELPGAGFHVGKSAFAQALRRDKAEGRQVVSEREMRSVVRGRAAAPGMVQRVWWRASRSRKKGCYAGVMSVNPTHPDHDASLPA